MTTNDKESADASGQPPAAGTEPVPSAASIAASSVKVAESPEGRTDGWAIAFGVVFWLTVISVVAYNSLGLGEPKLEIVVSASPGSPEASESWSVGGHLIYEGRFVEGITVWAIATDQQGNRVSTGPVVSDRSGRFRLEPVPHLIGGQSGQAIVEIAVHARGTLRTGDDGDGEIIELTPAPERLGIGTGQRFRIIGLPVAEMLILAGIFFLSVAIAIIPVPEGSTTTPWLVVKYLSSIVFAFLMTVFMILYISLGLRHVNLTASNVDNEVLSLGMASIFRGRYVDNASEEWLISMTSPSFPELRGDIARGGPASPVQSGAAPADASGGAAATQVPRTGAGSNPERPIEKGFGAPLWVLLVAVLGAALFTISIILVGIKEAPLQLQADEIRQRIQTVVLHQFYMLFAPIGAIFVYQLLVIAGAASQPAAVAVAVLAAGVSLNLLLEKARQTIVNLFSKTDVKLN